MDQVAPSRQTSHHRYPVADETDAAAVRRVVGRYAEQLGADAYTRGCAELVATELATNLVRHGKPGGWMLVRRVPPAQVELIAVDHGPGIADLPAALGGQVVSPGGLGCGLAAVRRASSYFDVQSAPGRGTTVLSIVDVADRRPAPDRPAPDRRTWGGVSIAVAEVCGDGWAVAELDHAIAVAVVDGLGHGAKASLASDAALATFATAPADLDGLVGRANDAMRNTRGAALTACVIDRDRQELRYVGVGNVNGRVVSGPGERSLICSMGTLGLKVVPPKVKLMTCPWPADGVLVIWTDGLSSRLELAAAPDLRAHDPGLVAAALHRDFARERDDATVVVVRP